MFLPTRTKHGFVSASLLALWGMADMPPLARDDRIGLRSIADGLRHVRRDPVLQGTYTVAPS